MKIKIWNPDMRDEADAQEMEAPGSLNDAAERFTNRNFANWDYPNEATVHIRAAGQLSVFKVEVRTEPVFVARLQK